MVLHSKLEIQGTWLFWMQETLVSFLGLEDSLEKVQATTPVFWPRECHGLYSPWGHRVRHHWATFTFTCGYYIKKCGTPTTNAEEAEADQFYKDLEDLLELTPKTDVLFTIGDWNAKAGSQNIPGVTGKFGLGEQNEAGQRLTILFQENALVIENTLFQQHKRQTSHMNITKWWALKSN